MSETILIGKRYKIFTENNFKYIGIILSRDDDFIKLNDETVKKEILIPLNKINSIEEVQ